VSFVAERIEAGGDHEGRRRVPPFAAPLW
jgi:hypothetical protein